MEYTGYIEGYYGRLLNWEERAQIVENLSKFSMNCYIYGPKEDLYHRNGWEKPYPTAWLGKLEHFVRLSNKRGVEIVPALAPGLSFDYKSSKDFSDLCAKFKSFIKCGVKTAALLMDDIPPELPAYLKGRFSSLGEVHGRLVGDLSREFKGKLNFWFCPTIYTRAFSNTAIKENLYLRDLSIFLPKSTPLFWTGDQVIAKTVQNKSLVELQKLFSSRILFWDNYYANDYCPRRIFLGSLKGRSQRVLSNLKGYFINPTGMINTDIFYLKILEGFFQSRPEGKSWQSALELIDFPKKYRPLLKYLDSPFSQTDLEKLPLEKIKKDIKLCTQYVFEEKGALHCEWFPFFQGIRADLSLKMKGNEPDFLQGMPSRQPDLIRGILRKQGLHA